MEALTVAVTVVFFLVYISVMFLSFILNGLILLTSLSTPELRASSNIIALHLSSIGFLLPVVFSPLTLTVFLQVMLSCNCSVLYYQWLLSQILHSGVYPMNILLWAINYFVTIKYSPKAITYLKASISLVIVWTISIAVNFPTVILTPPDVYIDCCETVCINGSLPCNMSVDELFTPRLFNEYGTLYYNARDIMIIAIPTILVLAITIASYCIYKRSVINSSVGLQVRMILLPIVMTGICSVHLIAQDSINWHKTQTTDERLPGMVVYIILHILWDTNGVLYAIVIFFFNVTLRRKCISFLAASNIMCSGNLFY